MFTHDTVAGVKRLQCQNMGHEQIGYNANYINPPLAGGGAYNVPPLVNFLNNLKMSADILAKLTVSYIASI